MAEEYEYTVHYFDVRGRAEPIRQILSYVGANWKDERIPHGDHPVIPEKIKKGKLQVKVHDQFVRCEINDFRLGGLSVPFISKFYNFSRNLSTSPTSGVRRQVFMSILHNLSLFGSQI